jgi:hypothetical protein
MVHLRSGPAHAWSLVEQIDMGHKLLLSAFVASWDCHPSASSVSRALQNQQAVRQCMRTTCIQSLGSPEPSGAIGFIYVLSTVAASMNCKQCRLGNVPMVLALLNVGKQRRV